MSVLLLMLSTSVTAVAGRSSSLQKTVDETQRTVQSMEENLTRSVNSLSQSTADIAARIDATEQQMRELLTLSEDNQRSIAQLQAAVDELLRVAYQSQGLTPPGGATVIPPMITDPGQPPGTMISPPPGITVTPPITTGQPPITTAPPVAVVATNMNQHYRAAQDYFTKGEYSSALKQFDEHILKFPTSPHLANATYWRAHCYFKMEDYPNAVKGFEQLRTQFASSDKVPTATFNEAVAYSRLGQPDKAKALFQQLIFEYPDDATTEQARKVLRQLQGLGQ